MNSSDYFSATEAMLRHPHYAVNTATTNLDTTRF